MTKLEKLLEGINGLRTPENEKTIKKLTEGIGLIAEEYRQRKAKEEKARLEAAGFIELDKHRKESGLSNKAFVESVGRTIIESSHPEAVKEQMMESLGAYARYLTEAVSGCIYSLKPMDDKAREYVANNDVQGLLKDWVLPRDAHKYGDAATAVRARIEKIGDGERIPLGENMYTVSRKLIDTDHEKLFLLVPAHVQVNAPYILHYADTPKAG